MRHDITERLADLAARRGTLIIDRAAEHVDYQCGCESRPDQRRHPATRRGGHGVRIQ